MTLIDDIKHDREAGTDGPWCRDCWDILSLGGPGNGHVAEISKPNGHDDKYWQKGEADANARRIARVPQMEAALLAAEELAEAQENYIAAVHAYEATPTDRGGVYGAKGTARTLMLTRYGLTQAALAAFRKALEVSE